MAEAPSQISGDLVDCPPLTPKIAPTTNDSSESESEAGSSSSERCVICLGKCRNKCYTDSCLHQFCFACLLQWSKVKPECPLCKQLFKSIIHNVKSMKEYDEYMIRTQPITIYESLPNEIHRVNYISSNPPTYTYQTTMQVRPQQSSQIYQLFMQSTPATERFSQEFANDHIPFRQHVQDWRRYIYRRGIYALPLNDITNRSRECSVEFFRENPAQIHRLLPWVNRELNALLRNNTFQVQTIMNHLQELFTQHDIMSSHFRSYFLTYLGERTDHFIHELLNFALSPYDMMGYDRSVRYVPYYNRPQQQSRGTATVGDNEVVISSGEESNSPQDLSCRSHNGRTEFTISTRSSHSTVIFRGSIEATIPTPSTSQQITPEDEEVAAHNQIALSSNGAVQITRNISVSSASSDECEFVLERKPPHLRTPEMVSLNSESDSDVVFVQEEREPPPPGVFEESKPPDVLTPGAQDPTLDDVKRKSRRLRTFDGPSTSHDTAAEAVESPVTPACERKPITLKIQKNKLKRIIEPSSDSDDDSITSSNSSLPKPQPRKRQKKNVKKEPRVLDKKTRLRSVIVKHDSKFYITKKEDSSSSSSWSQSEDTDNDCSSDENCHWTTTDGNNTE